MRSRRAACHPRRLFHSRSLAQTHSVRENGKRPWRGLQSNTIGDHRSTPTGDIPWALDRVAELVYATDPVARAA